MEFKELITKRRSTRRYTGKPVEIEKLRIAMEKEIKELANECLNCVKPTCIEGCPLKNNIPQFINYIKQNEEKKAWEELNKTTTQGIHKDTNTKQKQIIRSNSTNTLSKYNKTKSTQNNTMNTNTNKPKHTKHLNDVVKNSLNCTLNRIERIYGTLDIQHNNDHYYLNKYH